MTHTNIRRFAAGAGTLALAAAFTTLGAGAANAEVATASHTDGATSFTRTISDTTPTAGETITVDTEFERATDEYVYNIKNFHNACLTYVDGSATWNDDAIDEVEPVANDTTSPGEGSVLVKAPNKTSWKVNKNNPGIFSVKYTVGDSCTIGNPLESTFHYGGSLGDGIYSAANFEGGPAITVQEASAPGTGSLGSLGSLDLFGSFGSDSGSQSAS